MRKNGVNREIRKIDGGISAPAGFLTSAVSCGFFTDEKTEDLGLLFTERKCPTACVFTQNTSIGAPIKVCQERFKNGYAQAFVFNDGVANVFQDDGVLVAETIRRAVAEKVKADIGDVLIGSTGHIRQNLCLERVLYNVDSLTKGLDNVAYTSRFSVLSKENSVTELAYAFDLGNYECKIGALFIGHRKNMNYAAPLIGLLTTDVCISPEMLQRALEAEGATLMQLLNVDGVSTPNDTLCMMSSCKAGNYKISQTDSEYKKFCNALHEIVCVIAGYLAAEGRNSEKKLLCKVTGARSTHVAREIAREIVGNALLKRSIKDGGISAQDIVFLISRYVETKESADVKISLESSSGKVLLYEEGNVLPIEWFVLKMICAEKEITISIRFKRGNYTAMAFGCDLC